jgi:hypothetical protein
MRERELIILGARFKGSCGIRNFKQPGVICNLLFVYPAWQGVCSIMLCMPLRLMTLERRVPAMATDTCFLQDSGR